MTHAAPRDREVEAARARARAEKRFGRAAYSQARTSSDARCRYSRVANRKVPVLGLAAFAAVVPVALLHFVGGEDVSFDGWFHFAGVALGAGVATASAVALTVAGARQRDGHAVLVGSAFSVMAALLCLHGLATPGVLVGMNGVVAFTGGATLPVGSRHPRARRRPGAAPTRGSAAAARPARGGVVLILGLGVAALLEPTSSRPCPSRAARLRSPCSSPG